MKGEPWQIMYANVVKILERSVFLHQYPYTRTQTVAPILPTDMKVIGLDWDNARSAMRWQLYTQCRIRGASPPDILFWVGSPEESRHADHWPTPQENDEGFVITDTHPLYGGIAKWAGEAMELDDWISGAKVYLNRVLKNMKHPTWVEQYWPQIVPYVGSVPETLVKGMREPRPTSLQLDFALQDEIQNKLTLAALLPKDQELWAWVGRYHS